MKKFSIITVLAMLGTMAFTSSASAQCKVEDIFNKYKADTRCNSVNMSKEMLILMATQRGSDHIKEYVKNISSVKILSVKVPSSKKFSSYGISANGDSTVYYSGLETLNQWVGSLNDSSTTVGMGKTEDAEKKVKEKLVQKEVKFKKKQDEVKALMEQVVKDASSCIVASKYSELMSINEDGKQVKYFAKLEAEKIKEFVVETKSSREYSLIIIKGDDVKINSVSRLAFLVPNTRIDVDDYIH